MKNSIFKTTDICIFDDQIYHEHKKNDYSTNDSHMLYLFKLSSHFAKAHFFVRVKVNKQRLSYSVPENINVIKLPVYKSITELCYKPLKYWYKIAKQFKSLGDNQNRIHLFIWPHPVTMLFLLLNKFKKNIPTQILVVRLHMYPQIKNRYKGLNKLFALALITGLDKILKIIKYNDLFFTVGRESFNFYSKDFKNVYLTKHPLFTKENKPIPRNSQFRNITSKINIIFVGRLVPEKGLSSIIDAVEILLRENIEVNVEIVGEGLIEENLKKKVIQKSLSNHIHFHGYVAFGDKLFKLYRNADFLLLPSSAEGLPKVIMEAMIMGVPVVTSKAGGIEELIIHNKNGYLLNATTPEYIAKSIRHLSANPDKLSILQSNALKDAESFFIENEHQKLLSRLSEFLVKKNK